SIPIGFIALLIISVTLFMHSALFKNQAANLISEYMFHDNCCRLVLGEVSGNPLNNLHVSDLSVRYEGSAESYDMVRVDEIRIEYSLLSLIRGAFTINSAEFRNPHVWIKADSAGAGRAPGGGGALRGLFEIKVESFSISGGQIIYQGADKAEAVKSIDLEGMLRTGGERIEADITSGSCTFITRDIEVGSMSGGIAYGGSTTGENSLIFDSFRLGTESSRVVLSGDLSVDSLRMNLKVKASPVNIDEIGTALDIETGEMGRVNGTFQIEGRPGNLSVSASFDGKLKDYTFRDFEADLLIARNVDIKAFRGKLNGASVDGEGVYVTGRQTLKLSFQNRGMDLSNQFYPGADLPETDFNGRTEVRYLFGSSELYLDFYLGPGHFMEIPFRNAVISADYRNDSLMIKEMLARSSTHEVSINGSIVNQDTLRLLLEIECDASDTLFAYFDIEDYRADLDVQGLWEGTMDEWDLRLSGECRNFNYNRAFIPEGSVQFAVVKREDYSVFVDIRADTAFIDRHRFKDIDLSLEYAEGEVNIKKLNLAKSDVEAEMRGKYRVGEEESELVLDRASMRMLDEDWLSGGGFTIAITDSAVIFNDLQLHSRIGAVYFEGELNRFRNNFDGSLRFQRIDMSALNHNQFLLIPVEGSAAGVIRSSGSLSDPDLTVSLNLLNGSIDNIPVERFGLKAAYSSNHCRLDTLSLSSPAGFAFASGDIENISLDELYHWGTESLVETSSSLEIYCANLSVEPFIEYFPGIPFAEGTFTGKALVGGGLLHPRIRLDGTAGDIVFQHVTVPRVDLHADLTRSGITLEGEMYVEGSRKQGNFSGNLPLKENRWLYSLDREREMNFDLEITEIDLSRVADISDLVARAEGEGSLKFTVRGTVAAPDLSGDLRLTGAGFRLAGMEERFRKVNARVSFEDTLIRVRYLNGEEGKEGRFSGSGTVSLRGWRPVVYDLTVDTEKVMVTSIRDVAAIVTGKLDIGTDTVEGRAVPFLSGSFEVNEAEIYFNPGDMESGGGGEGVIKPGWMAELDLDMKGNTRIKTPDANIEFTGEVTLHHNEMGTYLRGELLLYRGWYNLYNNKFHIQSGSLIFSHAGGKRPLIDIEAVTYDQEGKRIYLTLVWDESDPQPRLSLRHEESGYSETDIWKMLGGGIVRSPNGSESEWDAMGTAQNLAANYLERVLNSQMEGFTVSLEHGNARQSGAFGGEKATMLAIGKYLSEGLYVQWKQGLSVATEAEVEVEYRISDLFLIRTELIKYSQELLPGESMRSGDEINVDVKIRWEF
ncbi:MAG: translocation/assembly module TamB domain-containing protein, partial [Candidatus Krumholzibacteriota bacterium]